MELYEFGDVRFWWQGECALEGDELTARFLVPDGADVPMEGIIGYEGSYYSLEQFRSETLLEKNSTYELYHTTDHGKVIIFHWATCRFAYGFPLSELHNGNTVRCWFNPEMKNQIPLQAVRFFSTAGVHAKLLQREAPILHASYIDYNGKAILFTAPAQTGKSTQAALWAQHVGAEIINGDRVLLRRREGVWHAFGYPCCGSSDICINRTLPLGAIVVLEQGTENRVEQMTVSQKVRALVSGTEVYLWDQRELDMAFSLAQELASQVAMVRLVCRPDADAVDTLRKYLEGGGVF